MKSITLFLLLTTIGLFVSSCGSKEEVKEEKEVNYLPMVQLEEASVMNFTHQITAQGNVTTEQDVMVNAEMGGLITKVHVKAGDRVTAGQTLVSLDVAILSSNAEEIQTQLDFAEYMLKKQEELKSRGVGSEFDYETAKNQVKSLKSRLNSLNTQKSKSYIKAPLMRLVNNNSVDIVADISEKHLKAVKVGTPINVTFPNFSGKELNLKITNVGNYIEATNRTFKITAAVNNNSELLPNMLAEVRITDMNVENGLVIPSKSILKSQNNDDYVFVATPSSKGNYSVKKVNVTLIEKQDGKALIEKNSNIVDGTKIIVEGARGITEKDLVRIK
jgi:multidrug efflux pump subunit AcrA (membrane-fusion protein)